MDKVKIDCARIHDWNSFHDEFDRVFGFPKFYGRNMNAWIDCMSSLHNPEDGMTKISCQNGLPMELHLEAAHDFKVRCPKQFSELVECTASVNLDMTNNGKKPALVLTFGD